MDILRTDKGGKLSSLGTDLSIRFKNTKDKQILHGGEIDIIQPIYKKGEKRECSNYRMSLAWALVYKIL